MIEKKMWKKTWKKICVPFAVLSILLMATGCGDLSDDQKTLIGAAAVAAKERATSFKVMKKLVTAKDPADRPAVERFLDSHGNRLNGQAKGLSDLNDAGKLSSKITEQMKVQISNEADTARASCENFIAMAPKLMSKSTSATDIAELDEMAKSHILALQTQAGILGEVALKIAKKKIQPAPVP